MVQADPYLQESIKTFSVSFNFFSAPFFFHSVKKVYQKAQNERTTFVS
jgi:hypothetical protein